jgi:hypothetical protein
MEKKLAQKEKEKKEENLRLMAQKAREERAGIRKEKVGGTCLFLKPGIFCSQMDAMYAYNFGFFPSIL